MHPTAQEIRGKHETLCDALVAMMQDVHQRLFDRDYEARTPLPNWTFGIALWQLCQIGLQLNYPDVSACKTAQGWYVAMRQDGQSHNMAEMLALQKTPTVNTDSTFLAGHCNGNQFEGEEDVGNVYRAMAADAGVNITGAVYKSGLARYPGDPRAWIRGKGDVQRICETEGWQCRGDVKVKGRQPDAPPAEVGVAADIVQQRVINRLEAEPELALEIAAKPAKCEEVFEQAKEQIAPPWAA